MADNYKDALLRSAGNAWDNITSIPGAMVDAVRAASKNNDNEVDWTNVLPPPYWALLKAYGMADSFKEAYSEATPEVRQQMLNELASGAGGAIGGIVGVALTSGTGPGALAGATGGATLLSPVGRGLAEAAGPYLGASGPDPNRTGPEALEQYATGALTEGGMELLGGGLMTGAGIAKQGAKNTIKRAFTPSAQQNALNQWAAGQTLSDGTNLLDNLPVAARTDNPVAEFASAVVGYTPTGMMPIRQGNHGALSAVEDVINRNLDNITPNPVSSGDAVEAVQRGVLAGRSKQAEELSGLIAGIPDVTATSGGAALKAGRKAALDSLKAYGDEIYSPVMKQYGDSALVDISQVRDVVQDIASADTPRRALAGFLTPDAKRIFGIFDEAPKSASKGIPGRQPDTPGQLLKPVPGGSSTPSGLTPRRLDAAGMPMGPTGRLDAAGKPVSPQGVMGPRPPQPDGVAGIHSGMVDHTGRARMPRRYDRLDPAGRPMPSVSPDVEDTSRYATGSSSNRVGPDGRKMSEPVAITLRQWKNLRSEIMRIAESLSREPGISPAVLKRISGAMNRSLEGSLESGLGGRITEDGVNAIRGAHEAWKKEASRLRAHMGPDSDGNVAAAFLDGAFLKADDALLESASRNTPDTIEAIKQGMTPVRGGADDPNLLNFQASATRSVFPIDSGSPSAVSSVLKRKPGVAESLGFGDIVNRYGSDDMVSRENMLNSGLWGKQIFNELSPAETRMRAMTRTPEAHRVTTELAGPDAPYVNRAYLSDLVESSKIRDRDLDSPSPVINPKKLDQSITKQRGVFDAAAGDTAEDLRNSVRVGLSTKGPEHLYGNPSGTARIGAALGLGSQIITTAGAIGHGAADGKFGVGEAIPLALALAGPYAAARALNSPRLGARLTSPVKPIDFSLRSSPVMANAMRGPLMAKSVMPEKKPEKKEINLIDLTDPDAEFQVPDDVMELIREKKRRTP